jgi:hypothetical protein
MRSSKSTQVTALTAAAAVVAGGFALAGGALTGGSDLPTPALSADRSATAAVAPAPTNVTPAVTAQDWQTVAGSVRRR